jgi:hypothetical protein
MLEPMLRGYAAQRAGNILPNTEFELTATRSAHSGFFWVFG